MVRHCRFVSVPLVHKRPASKLLQRPRPLAYFEQLAAPQAADLTQARLSYRDYLDNFTGKMNNERNLAKSLVRYLG